MQVEAKVAEQLKLKYGTAYTENSEEESLKIRIDADRTIDSNKLAEIVEARTEEIIENVWYQVPPEYNDKLLGGIILTGGGSNLKNIEQAFRRFTHIDKIHTAKFVNLSINTNIPDLIPHDGTMNTILSILAKGDENCAGSDINSDLFGNIDNAAATGRTAPGIVSNEEQKRKAEEEARIKKEEEERLEREKKEEEERLAKEKEEEERRKKSPANKLWGWMKKFGQTIVQADNENM